VQVRKATKTQFPEMNIKGGKNCPAYQILRLFCIFSGFFQKIDFLIFLHLCLFLLILTNMINIFKMFYKKYFRFFIFDNLGLFRSFFFKYQILKKILDLRKIFFV